MKKAIILANGAYPTHQIPVTQLLSGLPIICCDGAVTKLERHKIEPFAVVGDLDSVPEKIKQKYADRIFHKPNQETNDLTKAVNWCITQHFTHITILGATGLREDHTLGNISLLANYAQQVAIEMITDHGIFTSFRGTKTFNCSIGEQVSIFTLTPSEKVTTHQLKYPLHKNHLTSWWQGTLNETTYNSFTISSHNGIFIIYRNF